MGGIRWGVLAVVLAGVLVGCGAEAAGEPPPGIPYGSPTWSVQNDRALTTVADRLEPILRLQFADSYGGLVLEHETQTLIIYRKPNTAIDNRARAEAKDVNLVLRNARMTLVEMLALSDRVTADLAYWTRQGIVIGSVGPMPDGSGIAVMTTDGSPSDRANLMKRYATDAITLSAGTVVPAGGVLQG
ncbi:hypothetical protein [Kribbella sp. NPDC051718]|uniref:hypothetical protein n=1 Tax=Kribbella sp. NPDC051718 TaxID=3155168 RepID=UPI0034419A4E